MLNSQDMYRQFSLFQTPLDLAHGHWKTLLKKGDWAIDATCGNGKDTLELAKILSQDPIDSGVIAIDIQEQAIQTAKRACAEKKNIHFFCQSHAHFPLLAFEKPIRLIVYNLGYLPGSNKTVKTRAVTTLTSVKEGLSLLLPGGAISITCYPGHPEGAEEEALLFQHLRELNPQEYSVCFHQFVNRRASPSLLLIQKNN